ncbi:MAG: YggS family pyridoxal phosphate-dependent enzyme [Candidatus Omnitrophota bacterium]
MIKDNIEKIKNKISSVCSSIGRNPADIILIGISKYADSSQMNEAVAAGLTHIGENRVQDAKEKFSELMGAAAIVKHMVGHLQTNKVKAAVEIFDIIQSVDSLKLALEIQKQAERLNKKMVVLVQVNMSREVQKSGMAPEDIDQFLKSVRGLENIYIQGLMTIGPLTEDRIVVRECFREFKGIFDRIKDQYPADHRLQMKYLSMGMSGDFETALEEGANMIRVGRAIFHDS